MKLHEAAKQAIENEDVDLFAQVSEQLRFRLGMNYEQSRDFFTKHTGIDADEYEDWCYTADCREARGL